MTRFLILLVLVFPFLANAADFRNMRNCYRSLQALHKDSGYGHGFFISDLNDPSKHYYFGEKALWECNLNPLPGAVSNACFYLSGIPDTFGGLRKKEDDFEVARTKKGLVTTFGTAGIACPPSKGSGSCKEMPKKAGVDVLHNQLKKLIQELPENLMQDYTFTNHKGETFISSHRNAANEAAKVCSTFNAELRGPLAVLRGKLPVVPTPTPFPPGYVPPGSGRN